MTTVRVILVDWWQLRLDSRVLMPTLGREELKIIPTDKCFVKGSRKMWEKEDRSQEMIFFFQLVTMTAGFAWCETVK